MSERVRLPNVSELPGMGADPLDAARRVDLSPQPPLGGARGLSKDEVIDGLRERAAGLRERAAENDSALASIREIVAQGLGFNSTLIEDDVRIAVALAQRAVLLGLATDFTDDMQTRLATAAEPFRTDHLMSLGRGRAPRSGLERILNALPVPDTAKG